jgi:hypothetical protein
MWKMLVKLGEEVIQSRVYDWAGECTFNMDKADKYYTSRGDKVTIEMRDRDDRFIASIKTNQPEEQIV